MKDTKKIIALLTSLMIVAGSMTAIAADTKEDTTTVAAVEETIETDATATEVEEAEEVDDAEEAEEEAEDAEETEEAEDVDAEDEIPFDPEDYAEFDEDGVEVVIDGQKIEFDVQPIIIEDRTMVPLRAIFEALGAVVDWDNDTQTITAVKGDTAIMMQIDNKKMFVNSEEIEIDVAPMLKEDRTLVPLRAIGEAFYCGVYYIEDTETVVILSATEEAEEEEVAEEGIDADVEGDEEIISEEEVLTEEELGAPDEETEEEEVVNDAEGADVE